MSPHYDRHADLSGAPTVQIKASAGPDDDAIDGAAEALRQADLEAGQTEVDDRPADTEQRERIESSQLEDMSIDDLRALAAELDVPNRGQIIEQDELIEAIRQRL
jgi:hypothetical protein